MKIPLWLVGVVLVVCALPAGRSLAGGEPFTVAVLPDTQNFSMNHPEIYDAMCSWIVENREERNIVFVSHVGDIVNDDVAAQWANARRSHDILSAARIPQGLAIGNHDFDQRSADAARGENYRARFGPDALYDFQDPSKGTWREQPWWGGHSPTGLSSYQVLDPALTGGVPLLFLNVEVDLRPDEVAWAESVIERHRDRIVIISCHRYVYDYRLIRGRFEPFIYEHIDSLYTEESVGANGLFDEVIKPNPNVMMVWCGHVDGEFRQRSRNDAGLPVFELLQDFQSLSPRGGNGWLRLYEFDPGAGEIRVETFSPVVDGGRVRTRRDQVDELFEVIGDAGDVAGATGRRRLPFSIEDFDPQARALLAGALSQPGAVGAFVESMRTGEGRFGALINAVIATLDAETAARTRAFIRDFPYHAITPGIIDLMDREGEGFVEAVFAGDARGMLDYWREDDGRRVIEGFLERDTREPSFTLEVDFDAYLRAAAGG